MPNKGKIEGSGEGRATHHQEDCDRRSFEDPLAHGYFTPEAFGGWVKAPSPAAAGGKPDKLLSPRQFGLPPGVVSAAHRHLVRLSVTGSAWEGASEETRETIRETLSLIGCLERNIKNLLDGAESAKRYAEEMLPQYLAFRKEEAKRFGRFFKETLRGLSLDVARDLLRELKKVLKSVKEEGKSGHRGRYSDATWLSDKTAAINKIIAPRLVLDERAPCTPEIIQQLKTKSPDDVARLLVGKVYPDVSADALRRPRVRRRPSNKCGQASPAAAHSQQHAPSLRSARGHDGRGPSAQAAGHEAPAPGEEGANNAGGRHPRREHQHFITEDEADSE